MHGMKTLNNADNIKERVWLISRFAEKLIPKCIAGFNLFEVASEVTSFTNSQKHLLQSNMHVCKCIFDG